MVSPVFVNSRAPIPVQADRMARLEDQLQRVQSQVATGERFATPSEAPADAQRAAALDRLLSRISSDHRVMDRAAGRLALAETAMGNAFDALVRARELGLAMANGTASAEDRAVFAAELSVVRSQLLGAANTRDEGGRWLFAGATGGAPAFTPDADGVVRWTGFANGAGAEGAGVEGAMPPPGPALFGDMESGAFAAVDRLLAAATEPDPLLREPAIATALHQLETGQSRLLTGQALLGAGLARLESEQARLDQAEIDATDGLARAQGLDLTAAIADLAALELSLTAARQTFARVYDGTLFDQLR
jgi:flagellar hook-associated protein 3 FlgL